MAEEEKKSFYRRAVEYLQAPPERQLKGLTYNQSTNSALDSAVFGYNTSSGQFPSKLLEDIGEGTGNSAVVACLNVLATSFAEPPLKIFNKNSEGDEEQISHPVEMLMSRPNPFTSGSLLSHYIVTAINASGDAYMLKIRNSSGRVIQLIPMMPDRVVPRGNEDELITHYEYYGAANTMGEFVVIKKEDIVHIRQGIDPNNHRRGFAPLKSVLRELLGDEAAGQYATALLHNMAVPGVILSPKDDATGGPSREEAEAIAKMYKSKFGGANRGAPMVLTGPMDVKPVSFSPDQMDLKELRRLPEERVSAVLGVPAILAGLGAGLDAATYNNTRELREFFTEQKLIPMWKTVANELTHQLLLSDFTNDTNTYCAYDLDKVRALAADKNDTFKRFNMGVAGGWVTISEARKAANLDTDETHDVYLRPLNMVAVPIEQGNQPYQITQDQADAVQEAGINIEGLDLKATLSSVSLPVESVRQDRIEMIDEPRNEEKYIAQMPNGAWCVIGHEDEKVIECFKTEAEAEAFLEDMKKSFKAPAISAKVKKTLQKKVADHNAKNPKYRATYGMLAAVFRRGVGAYRTNPASVRGNVTGATQWGIARVNAFLKGLKGSFPRKPFDRDLLPSGHPLSSKKEAENVIDELKVSTEEAEALLYAERMENETAEKAKSVKVGDTVSWSINKDPDPPSTVHGVVTSVKEEEATMVVWAIMDNGDHKKTDRSVTMPISKLTKIKDWRKDAKAKDDITNFPKSGDNQKISLANSQYKQFPDFKYVKDLKENYPTIWRRAGTGGNPPTAFTGNDAFNKWSAYKKGDRSPSVLSWVKRRERFMNRHKGNNRLNGAIAVMKWGGVTTGGVSEMKKLVNEQKKKVDARKKKADILLSEKTSEK
jgi:HK97 family phage portal protein